jgi:hypothetical protein
MTDSLVTRVGQIVVYETAITDAWLTRVGQIVVYATAPQPDNPGGGTSGAGAPFRLPARGGAVYLDSYLEYDGRHAGADDGLFPGAYLTLSDGSTWAPGEEFTLTASKDVFTADDVGNLILVHANSPTDLTVVRLTITAYTSATEVTVTPNVAVPAGMRETAMLIWDKAVDVVAGLDHLEAKAVGILADDHVVGSPNNARIVLRTVTDGAVDLGDFYSHIYVGLPYLADLETLDVDNASGSTLKATRMDVTKVGLHVYKSRSVWVGNRRPPNDETDPLADLEEMPKPAEVDYEILRDEYEDVNIKGQWNSNGRVFIRSVDPVPSTVLAAIPQGHLPPVGSV